jgi:hypothetical protein
MENEIKQKLEFKDILNVVFKLTDYLNFLWNFYVVFNVAVIGWLFSTSKVSHVISIVRRLYAK